MRTLRLLGAMALACASVPLVSQGAAHADGAALVPSNAAYFYSLGIDKPEASPADPPNLTADADGVSPGHLAVASQGGNEDKVSFLYFDLFTLPEGITVTKAVVTMKTVADAPPDDLSFQAAPGSVVACKAGDEGFSGDDGNGLVNAPKRLCDAFKAKGTAGAPGTYQWDVTALAQTWADGINDGVAFTRDDAAPSSNFQVVFDAAPTATMQLEYSLPVPELPIEDPTVITPPVPQVPAVGGFVPPPSDGFAPAPEIPVMPNPTVNLPPTSAGGPAATVAAKPVVLSTSLRPGSDLWLAGLVLAGTLVLLSLILGDPRAAAATRSTSRLSLALAGNKRLAPVGTLTPRHL